MRWPEVIYQGVNESRVIVHFNKIPGEKKRSSMKLSPNDFGLYEVPPFVNLKIISTHKVSAS